VATEAAKGGRGGIEVMVAGYESFEWIWEGEDGTAATGDLSEGRRNEGATSGEGGARV
jgi:hypothetical protein